MNEIVERYQRRADAFEANVEAVAAEQWDNPSPCEKWSAGDVVDHIIAMHGYMLRPIGRSAPERTEDRLADFRAARKAVQDLLDDPAVAGQEVETPTGKMTFAAQIDGVVSDDLPLHGWDLARATGQDETIDPVDVERLWASTTATPAELMEQYRTPGAFGPDVEVFGAEVSVPADASLQDRLLGLIGRQP
ncbi:TIGR03086 family metal-binding protein [Tenggerimyces flavus]|uniref:TIGR03086 family metal-binding protein n=1 Tax=Tenggerimyces flavus TaxID=1708749 RepID=A0ABV7YDG4_9ACTN|nr:TIGR03086 family metal-binding protein [Tenggerimyces flavus]MBM7788947.1 uncharacterized protein (TIGR03086 family) [Tenggerimyces flavus]